MMSTLCIGSFVFGLIAGVLLTLSAAFEMGLGFTGGGVLATIAVLIGLIAFVMYIKSSDTFIIYTSQIVMAFCVGITAGYGVAVQIASRAVQ